MKVQCDVCQKAEAAMLCCADEAALCRSCDEEIHAANKLAGKHQRVPLLHRHPSQAPTCDICQERAGYFFCLEDRALLCRQCDVSVHTATPYVTSHQRFLVTGVRVALQHVPPDHHHRNPSSSSDLSATRNNPSSSSDLNATRNNPSSGGSASSEASRSSAAAAAATAAAAEELRQRWPWDEVFAGEEFDTCFFGYDDFGG